MLKKYLQLIRFDKPIGSFLLLWPTLWALFFAASGVPNLKYIFVFICGVFLTRAAGCAFNDLFDAKFDKSVRRTKGRPLAAGVINKKQAIAVAVGLSLAAFLLAIITLDVYTILLCIPAIIIYASYPLFKRFFPVPQAYLGVAYSFGILMAFMQIQQQVSGLAIAIFFANLFWVIGYDTIYALVDLEDDLKIGIKTSAITFGKYVNHIIAACYIIFISIMLVCGIYLRLKIWYFIGLGLSSLLIIYQVTILMDGIKEKYLSLFLLNNQVGLFLFLGVVLAYL